MNTLNLRWDHSSIGWIGAVDVENLMYGNMMMMICIVYVVQMIRMVEMIVCIGRLHCCCVLCWFVLVLFVLVCVGFVSVGFV